jgi:membrane protein
MEKIPVQIRLRKTAFHEWLWRHPAADEGGLSRVLRATCRVAIVFWREFWRDDILLRASALTFAVILSVVPVLALSTAVLKGLGAGDQMRTAAHRFIDSMAVDAAMEKVPPMPDEGPPANIERQIVAETFSLHLTRAIDTIFDYVERTDFATLGLVGVAGLFITVISMLATIEDSMNAVWHTEAGRPLGRKVMDYLALMLLLPLAVNVTMAGMAAFQSERASRLIELLFPVAWAGPLFINLLILGILVATLTICYRFLPSCRVNFRPALIGGLIGGIAWLLLQAFYVYLQVGVARYNAIYGSFATLPLFLLWVYSSWVIFLAGAEVSFAVHTWRQYVPHRKKLPPSVRLGLALDLLAMVYEDFRHRRPSKIASLSQRLAFSEGDVRNMAGELLAAGLLRPVTDKENGLLPATEAGRVQTTELVDTVWGTVDLYSVGGRLAAEALAGAKAALADRTLQEIAIAPPEKGADPHKNHGAVLP